jgi:hypothetical protein
MSRAAQVQDDVKLGLDIAVATNFAALKQSGQLPQYLIDNKEAVLDKIYQSKNDNISKTMGDLERAIDTQNSTYMYYKRNHDFLKLGEDPIRRMQQDVKNLQEDRDSAQRQYEINQWTSGNRSDTLFVYQVIFIAVLLQALFTGLWRMGIISAGFVGFLAFWLVVIVILTTVNRAQYTKYLRNKRYWNKKDYPRFAGPPIPTPDCPAASDVLKKTYESVSGAVTNAPNNFVSGLQGVTNMVASGASSATSGLDALKTPA